MYKRILFEIAVYELYEFCEFEFDVILHLFVIVEMPFALVRE